MGTLEEYVEYTDSYYLSRVDAGAVAMGSSSQNPGQDVWSSRALA